MYTVITDPGVDDLVALALLKKLINEKVSAISSFGNVSLEKTDQNLREFIKFAASDWECFKGSSLPLTKENLLPWASNYHGVDGTWNIHPETSLNQIDLLNNYPRNSQVISLGPLTDLYKLSQEVTLEKITIMGGAFNIEGNETKFAEFNIASDPESVNKFFQNSQQAEINIVPLDVTHLVSFTLKDVKAIQDTNKVNIWLKRLLLAWFKNYKGGTINTFELYDPLAVYLHFFPDEANWTCGNISVIQAGEKRGRTILKEDPNSRTRIAASLQNAEKIKQKIFGLLF